MMQSSRHDKTKTSHCVKLVPLSRDDSRCDGLAPGMVLLACNTCDYLSKPTKDDSHNISQANLTARKAHAPTAMVRGTVESAPLPHADQVDAGVAAPRNHTQSLHETVTVEYRRAYAALQ